MSLDKSTINTPHAAVIVFNYADRIAGMADPELVNTTTNPNRYLTLSVVSIQTSKSKVDPQGSFNLVLAPDFNWVSVITPGSWCAILMSNEPITQEDLKQTANKNQIKMIGKIDSVRLDTQVQEDGSRRTLYYVTGIDWGHIFHSMLYIDPSLFSQDSSPQEANNNGQSQGSPAYIAITKALFKNGVPQTFVVNENLNALVQLFGKSLGGLTDAGNAINRLSNSIYTFKMPTSMINYFHFRNFEGDTVNSEDINDFLTITTGSLIQEDTYHDFQEALGFLNPITFQGAYSLWQVLLDNSNPALNEMFCEIRWQDQQDPFDNALQLVLYNRIKPFSFKNFSPEAGLSSTLKSYFQYIRQHDINPNTVISINSGTNWRDKYNFIEIKPQFQDFQIFANWVKQKTQVADQVAFSREGFRPLILDTKQFPSSGLDKPDIDSINSHIDWDQLEVWANLAKEWFFDTHRTLNGTLVMTGTTEYIAVGDNIKFDAQLLNPNKNFITEQIKSPQTDFFVLAHVENISHSFTVQPDGSRTYNTTIQFVRGIIVDSQNLTVGSGAIDALAPESTLTQRRNSMNTFALSDDDDPQLKDPNDGDI